MTYERVSVRVHFSRGVDGGCFVIVVYLIVVFDAEGFFFFGCGYGKVLPQDNVVRLVDWQLGVVIGMERRDFT